MYTLMIAEDDDTIRQGLIKIIRRMELPISEIREAADGRSALRQISEHPPDLLLTDIRMPETDGLDLLDQVRRSHPRLKTIILSGYSEFSYAQRAIQNQVAGYLLKPVRKDRLRAALEDLVAQLDREREQDESRSADGRRANEYRTLLLREILQGIHDGEDIDAVLREAGVRFASIGFAVLSLRGRQDAMHLPESLRLSLPIGAVVHEYSPFPRFRTALLDLDETAWQAFRAALPDLLSEASRDGHPGLHAGLSLWQPDAADLAGLARQSLDALDRRLFEFSTPLHIHVPATPAPVPPLSAHFHELRNALEGGGPSAVNQSVDRLCAQFLQRPEASADLLQRTFEQFIHIHLPEPKRTHALQKADFARLIRSSDSLNDFGNGVKQLLLSLTSEVPEVRRGTMRIDAAVRYMEENCAKGLSLSDVARHVNASPSYFSHAFHKETGMTFSDCLQKIRVEKTKPLLLKPGLKIYDIAAQAGFPDDKYYFKIFKKLTGMTPSQYRNRNA